jgi:hypothetical protein
MSMTKAIAIGFAATATVTVALIGVLVIGFKVPWEAGTALAPLLFFVVFTVAGALLLPQTRPIYPARGVSFAFRSPDPEQQKLPRWYDKPPFDTLRAIGPMWTIIGAFVGVATLVLNVADRCSRAASQ